MGMMLFCDFIQIKCPKLYMKFKLTVFSMTFSRVNKKDNYITHYNNGNIIKQVINKKLLKIKII